MLSRFVSFIATVLLAVGALAPAVHARFLQTDPVGYGDNTNLYSYVANDPVNNTDPTGLICLGQNCDPSPSELSETVSQRTGEQIDAAVEAAPDAALAAGAMVVNTMAIAADVANTPVSPGPDVSIATAAVTARFTSGVLKAGVDDSVEAAASQISAERVGAQIESAVNDVLGIKRGELTASTQEVRFAEVAEQSSANAIRAQTTEAGKINPNTIPKTGAAKFVEAARIVVRITIETLGRF